MARRRLPFLLLATVALLGLTPITDGDVWWHLKFGEVFWQSRGFPAHDPFVFTAGPDPWVIRAWLAEVLLYGVYRLAGPAVLILLKAALFTGALALLLAAVEAAQQGGLRDATLLAWKAAILAGLGRPTEAEAVARAARLVLADLRAQAGDRAEAIRLLRALLAFPDLAPDQRREAEGQLRDMATPQ